MADVGLGFSTDATLCPHGKIRSLVPCMECWEEVMKQTYGCVRRHRVALKSTNNNLPCEHCCERRRCKICKGSWICTHGKNKVYCRECDGRRLCQVCFEKSLPRCFEVCKGCREDREAKGQVMAQKWKPII